MEIRRLPRTGRVRLLPKNCFPNLHVMKDSLQKHNDKSHVDSICIIVPGHNVILRARSQLLP